MGTEVDGVASSLATKLPCESALYQATTAHRRQKITSAATPRTSGACTTVVTCVRRGTSTDQVTVSHPRAYKGKRRAAYSRPPTAFTTAQRYTLPTTTSEGNRRAQFGAAGGVADLRNHAAVGRGAGSALSPALGTQPQFQQRLQQEQHQSILQARATSDSSQHVTAMGSTMSKGQNHKIEGAKSPDPLPGTPTIASAEPAATTSARTSKIRSRATIPNSKPSSRRAKRAVSSRATCPAATSAASSFTTKAASAQRMSCRTNSTGTATPVLATKPVLKQTFAQRRRAVMPTAASRRPPRAAAVLAAARLRHEQERAHSPSGSSESEQVDQDACGSIRRWRSSSSQLGGYHTGKRSVGSRSTGGGSSGGGDEAEGKESVAKCGGRGVTERRVSLEDVWNALGAEYFQDPHVVQDLLSALIVENGGQPLRVRSETDPWRNSFGRDGPARAGRRETGGTAHAGQYPGETSGSGNGGGACGGVDGQGWQQRIPRRGESAATANVCGWENIINSGAAGALRSICKPGTRYRWKAVRRPGHPTDGGGVSQNNGYQFVRVETIGSEWQSESMEKCGLSSPIAREEQDIGGGPNDVAVVLGAADPPGKRSSPRLCNGSPPNEEVVDAPAEAEIVRDATAVAVASKTQNIGGMHGAAGASPTSASMLGAAGAPPAVVPPRDATVVVAAAKNRSRNAVTAAAAARATPRRRSRAEAVDTAGNSSPASRSSLSNTSVGGTCPSATPHSQLKDSRSGRMMRAARRSNATSAADAGGEKPPTSIIAPPVTTVAATAVRNAAARSRASTETLGSDSTAGGAPAVGFEGMVTAPAGAELSGIVRPGRDASTTTSKAGTVSSLTVSAQIRKDELGSVNSTAQCALAPAATGATPPVTAVGIVQTPSLVTNLWPAQRAMCGHGSGTFGRSSAVFSNHGQASNSSHASHAPHCCANSGQCEHPSPKSPFPNCTLQTLEGRRLATNEVSSRLGTLTEALSLLEDVAILPALERVAGAVQISVDQSPEDRAKNIAAIRIERAWRGVCHVRSPAPRGGTRRRARARSFASLSSAAADVSSHRGGRPENGSGGGGCGTHSGSGHCHVRKAAGSPSSRHEMGGNRDSDGDDDTWSPSRSTDRGNNKRRRKQQQQKQRRQQGAQLPPRQQHRNLPTVVPALSASPSATSSDDGDIPVVASDSPPPWSRRRRPVSASDYISGTPPHEGPPEHSLASNRGNRKRSASTRAEQLPLERSAVDTVVGDAGQGSPPKRNRRSGRLQLYAVRTATGVAAGDSKQDSGGSSGCRRPSLKGFSKGVLVLDTAGEECDTDTSSGKNDGSPAGKGDGGGVCRNSQRHCTDRGRPDDGKRHCCREFDCSRRAHFGTPGWIPVHCEEHRRDWEVFLKYASCLSEGCQERPAFGIPGDCSRVYCRRHRITGTVTLASAGWKMPEGPGSAGAGGWVEAEEDGMGVPVDSDAEEDFEEMAASEAAATAASARKVALELGAPASQTTAVDCSKVGASLVRGGGGGGDGDGYVKGDAVAAEQKRGGSKGVASPALKDGQAGNRSSAGRTNRASVAKSSPRKNGASKDRSRRPDGTIRQRKRNNDLEGSEITDNNSRSDSDSDDSASDSDSDGQSSSGSDRSDPSSSLNSSDELSSNDEDNPAASADSDDSEDDEDSADDPVYAPGRFVFLKPKKACDRPILVGKVLPSTPASAALAEGGSPARPPRPSSPEVVPPPTIPVSSATALLLAQVAALTANPTGSNLSDIVGGGASAIAASFTSGGGVAGIGGTGGRSRGAVGGGGAAEQAVDKKGPVNSDAKKWIYVHWHTPASLRRVDYCRGPFTPDFVKKEGSKSGGWAPFVTKIRKSSVVVSCAGLLQSRCIPAEVLKELGV